MKTKAEADIGLVLVLFVMSAGVVVVIITRRTRKKERKKKRKEKKKKKREEKERNKERRKADEAQPSSTSIMTFTEAASFETSGCSFTLKKEVPKSKVPCKNQGTCESWVVFHKSSN